MSNETEQIFILNSSDIHTSTDSQKLTELVENTEVNLDHVEDFSNVCRTCATVTEFVIPIFDGEGAQNNLAEKIHKHLPIQVCEQDILPRVLCYQCASTLLACHDLQLAAERADRALRARLIASQPHTEQNMKIESTKNEAKPSLEKDQQNKHPCEDFPSYLDPGGSSQGDKKPILKFEIEDANTEDYDNRMSDDDEPLASIASRKTSDAYNTFYTALLNFKDHFVKGHSKSDSCDSSESEEYSEDNCDIEQNIDNFDDLTECNMRKDKMDEGTRQELSETQIKINGKVYYTCKICGKNLSSSHTYLFHKRIHTGERPCVCHICGKQFRAPNGLQRHLTETHEKLRRHSCRYCPKTFANTQNLKQHMRIHTGERPFICTHCGKRFTQSGSLHVHLKTHTEHFPHVCAECGAKFRLRSGLVRHRLKHTGERPHVCAHCGKGFRQRHELNSHTLSHTDTKPHSCAICGASFRQRRALRHHYKRSHELDAIPKDIGHPPVYQHIGHY